MSGRLKRPCCAAFKLVSGISSAILGDREDAKDATQVALLQVLRSAKTFRGDSRLETWAARIALREAMRLARDRRRREARRFTEADVDCTIPSSLQLNLGSPRQLQRYLNRLPEPLRNVFVLRYGLDYTLSEMAEIAKTSPNTIKARLVRARAAMRRIVQREALGANTPVHVRSTLEVAGPRAKAARHHELGANSAPF